MSKRAFIVHGWDGYPEEGWFPWLKQQLEKQGFQVFVPQLPEPGTPRIFNWVPRLAETVGQADAETFFIGHSMGCQTIVRYLESLPANVKVGGAVFVAGFLKRLQGLEDDDEVRDVAKHWLESPLDLYKVRSHLDRSVAIFSDNDPYVPLDNQEEFRDQLGSQIIVEHGKGHFSGNLNGVFAMPAVLEAVLKFS